MAGSEQYRRPGMTSMQGPTGKPTDPTTLSEEDAAARRAKDEARQLDRQPDESDEQYTVRMRKMKRSRMTGAEVMEYDRQMARLDREERLKREPDCRGTIQSVEDVDGRGVRFRCAVEFDKSHPEAPNRVGEISIDSGRCFQFYNENGEQRMRSLQTPLKDTVGVLRWDMNPRDGGKMWLFVADADSDNG